MKRFSFFFLVFSVLSMFSFGVSAGMTPDKVVIQKISGSFVFWYDAEVDTLLETGCKDTSIGNCEVHGTSSSLFYDVDGLKGYWDGTSYTTYNCEYWNLGASPDEWDNSDSCTKSGRTTYIYVVEEYNMTDWDYSEFSGVVRLEWMSGGTWYAQEVWIDY